MTEALQNLLLIASLLGLWSGPVVGKDWKPETTEEREWAAAWVSFAVLEAVRAQMEATETGIANGTISADARGFSNLGAGMLLASVPDILLMDVLGPAQAWLPMARSQYIALRQILTDQSDTPNRLAALQALPTGKMFTAINYHMMAHAGFTALELEQLRDTMARSFDEK